jgi:hypothetical protein
VWEYVVQPLKSIQWPLHGSPGFFVPGAMEADRIGPVLDKAASALVNSQLVARIARCSRIVDDLNRAMREQRDKHAAATAEPVKAGEKILPLLIGLDVTLSIGGALDGLPTARNAGGVPDERLNRVNAVEHDRLVVVPFVSESGYCIDDVVVTRERAECLDLESGRTTVFNL